MAHTTTPAVPAAAPAPHKPWYKVLYIQVLIAIALGILVGHLYPQTGAALKPLGDGFIQLIKMMIAPVIFCTVVHGIASMSDLKKRRPRRAEDADLFRGGLDARAGSSGSSSARSSSPARASTSTPPRSIPSRCRAT